MKVRYDPVTGEEIRTTMFDPDPLADEDDEQALEEMVTVRVTSDEDEAHVRWQVSTLRERMQFLLGAITEMRLKADAQDGDCCVQRRGMYEDLVRIGTQMEGWELALWDY